jgi:hypothetical protein
MATAVSKTRCVICGKEKATFRCAGCLQEFCHKHLGDHRQELNKELDEIEVNHDIFRQSLIQYIEQFNNDSLMKQINKWEQNSIEIIQKTAEEARQAILRNTNENIRQTEIKLNELTNQLRQSRDEDDFNETNLRQYQEELERLTKAFTKPSNISIREDSTSVIKKISVNVSSKFVTLILIS